MVTTGFNGVAVGSGSGADSIWLFDCILVEITAEDDAEDEEEEEDEEDVVEDVDDEDVLDVEPMRDDWDVCDFVLFGFGVGFGVGVGVDDDDTAAWLELVDGSFRLNFTLVAINLNWDYF